MREEFLALYEKACAGLPKLFKFSSSDVKISGELESSLSFLGLGLGAGDVASFAKGVFFVSLAFFLMVSLVFAFFGRGFVFFVLLSFALPYLFSCFVMDFPNLCARAKAGCALSHSAELVALIVAELKQNSNLESAVRVASRFGDGGLSREFGKLLSDAVLGKKGLEDGVLGLADKYGVYEPGFKKSLLLVLSSFSERDVARRMGVLDRACSAVLSCKKSRMQDYMNGLYFPTMAILSFGTVLPLIIISLLPIVSLLGLEVASPFRLVLLLFLVLFGIWFYGNKVLSCRPVGFSKISIPRDESKEEFSFYFVLTLLVFFSIPSILFLFQALGLVYVFNPAFLFVLRFHGLVLLFGFGLSLSLWFYSVSNYRLAKREKAKVLEDEALDAFFAVSGRMKEARSPEEAVSHVSVCFKGRPISGVFSGIVSKVRLGGASLSVAFLDSCSSVHSNTVRALFFVFSKSLERGAACAGEMLDVACDSFLGLRRIESDMRRELAKYTQVMRYSVVFFAPFICALVVTFQKLVFRGFVEASKGSYLLGELFSLNTSSFPLSTQFLQLVVGFYTIGLALVLLNYVTRIEFGDDDIAVSSAYARNIPVVLVVFFLSLFVSNFLFN